MPSEVGFFVRRVLDLGTSSFEKISSSVVQINPVKEINMYGVSVYGWYLFLRVSLGSVLSSCGSNSSITIRSE